MNKLKAAFFLGVAVTPLLFMAAFWPVAIARNGLMKGPDYEIYYGPFPVYMLELIMLTLITIPVSIACAMRAIQLFGNNPLRFASLPGVPLYARVSAVLFVIMIAYYCAFNTEWRFWRQGVAKLFGQAPSRPALTDERVKFPTLPLAAPNPYGWEVKDLEGKAVSMAQFKGKPLFLNFWATWCGPCRREMPNIQRLHEQMKAEGVDFALVSNETPEKVKEFLAKEKYTFPVYLIEGEPPAPFEVNGIPATYVLTPQGEIALHHVGSTGWDGEATKNFLRDMLKHYAAPKPA